MDQNIQIYWRLMQMKNEILKKAKEIAIPNNIQRKKVDKIANQVFSLVNKEV